MKWTAKTARGPMAFLAVFLICVLGPCATMDDGWLCQHPGCDLDTRHEHRVD